MRRLGAPEEQMLIARGNLANTCDMLGRLKRPSRARRDVYSGTFEAQLWEEHRMTLEQPATRRRPLLA